MKLDVDIETFPIAGEFRISRGTKREARVVVARISDGGFSGAGECTPYARYGETPEATRDAILAARLPERLPPGAARNALDCAFLDFEAKRKVKRAYELLGLPAPQPMTTCLTISLDTPEAMAEKAAAAAKFPLLKLKLGGAADAERLAAVRAARPDARLIADANEAWTDALLEPLLAAAANAGLEMVEQPLPAGQDQWLAAINRPLPVCADESAHGADSLAALVGRYDAVNIKLDKTGGLTAAIAAVERAKALGLDVMVGCMVATSLAMAPALLLGGKARWIDLDGPLLLARDRVPGLRYEGATVFPAGPELWG